MPADGSDLVSEGRDGEPALNGVDQADGAGRWQGFGDRGEVGEVDHGVIVFMPMASPFLINENISNPAFTKR